MVQESSHSEALSLSWEHFILTQRQRREGGRGKGNIWEKKKNTTSLAVYKAFFLKVKSQVFLYLHYRRAQLMDADCLATPRPYNIYHFLLHCFIFLKTFFSKKDKCKHVSSQLGKTKVSMHFFSPSLLFKTILPHCPGKRTAQKVDGYITLKICNIS